MPRSWTVLLSLAAALGGYALWRHSRNEPFVPSWLRAKSFATTRNPPINIRHFVAPLQLNESPYLMPEQTMDSSALRSLQEVGLHPGQGWGDVVDVE